MRGGIKFSTPKRLQQEPRYQFCSSLYTKLDEDVTEMEFHSLLTYQQTQPDLRVCQSLDATQRHLRFASTQVLVLNHSLNDSFESATADAAVNALRIRLHPALFTSRYHFLRSEDAISGSMIACAVSVILGLALNTELRDQPLEPASDCAQTDNAREVHQLSYS